MVYAVIAVAVLAVLVAVLLHVNVRVHLSYQSSEDVFHAQVHYLWITKVISPPQKSKRKKKKDKKPTDKKPAEKEKKSPIGSLIKEKGIVGFLDTLKQAVSSIWHILVALLRRSTLKDFTVKISVAGEDAADTAIKYGYANSVVYPIAGAILETVHKCQEQSIELTPDFSEGAESSVLINADLLLKPAKFIAVFMSNREEIITLIKAFSGSTK